MDTIINSENELIEQLVLSVKEETDTKKAIDKMADLFFVVKKSDCEDHKMMMDEVKKTRKAVMGNGNVKDSLMFRVANLEKWMKYLLAGGAFIATGIGGWIITSLLGLIK